MTPVLIAGLVVLAAGIFGWLISKRLARIAGRSHPFLATDTDRIRFQKRQLFLIRITGSSLALFGLGLSIFGLVNGV